MTDDFEVRDETVAKLTGMGPGGPIPAVVVAADWAVIWLARVLVCTTLTALFGILLANVVLRYAFSSGLVWSQEIAALLFPWLVIAGAVLAAQIDRHIAVKVIVNLLPRAVQGVLMVGVNVLIVAMAVIVVDASLVIMEAGHRNRLAVTGLPQSIGYASLIYGYAMVGITAVTTGYRQIFAKPES